MTAVDTHEPTRFDIAGPLPAPGVTLLEASAGTGKTFTIAALVARFVAEGVPIDRILAVTFTRMATAELRGRVRERLVASAERMRLLSSLGSTAVDRDLVDESLTSGPGDIVKAREQRLANAVANFDAATITTTHGFCQLVLGSLGVSGSVGLDAELTEDAGDVVDEVVDDLYTRWCLMRGVPFSLREARSAVRAALANPGTALAPAPDGSAADLQRRLAIAARVEVGRRLAEASLLTYDDLLSRLSDALGGEPLDGGDPGGAAGDDDDRVARGKEACGLLRERYDVVLVDEFQDTDPIQWSVVKNAFGQGGTVLVLIGDPKQAIYSFRGGDVYSYLEAARVASSRFTLAENWRSDAGLVAAYDALLSPAQLGHPEILYREVSVPESHKEPGLIGTPADVPLRIRLVRGSDHAELVRNSYGVSKGSAEQWIAGDLAQDIGALLESKARLVRDPGRQGTIITPGDIAVLVRTNRQAQRVQEALRSAGIPVVATGADSVFWTSSAKHWLRLLEALEQPASRSRAAAVALTPFVGMAAEQVATADESEWEDVHARLHAWAEVLRRRGVAALYRWVLADARVPARTLPEPGGARTLTDLGHIAQLLHSERSLSLLGPTALRSWLSRRVEDSAADGEIEERTRRLESDADAVQVLTIHRAKGLEFPVVYCPYLWDCGRGPDREAPAVYHDPASEFARMLDVGTAHPARELIEHRRLELDERRGEDLRLMYVALTRARHRMVLWWVRVKESEQSPLYRVLAGRRLDGSFDPRPKQPKDSEVEQRMQQLAGLAPGCISVERCSPVPTGSPSSDASPGGARSRSLDQDHVDAPFSMDESTAAMLGVARLSRSLDQSWRRTSYSGIIAGDLRTSDQTVASEPEHGGVIDEPDNLAEPVAVALLRGTGEDDLDEHGPDEHELKGHPLPLGSMPGGAGVGTFVHRVMERIDFAAPDLEAHVGSVLSSEWARRPVELEDPTVLTAGLVSAIRTPLGPLVPGLSLGGINRRDRLDEVVFELPLAGGDSPIGSIAIPDISRLFAAHLDPAGLLRGYSGRLDSSSLVGDLRGYLTGSLDLVFRADDGIGPRRYFVADYKTNRLGSAGEALSAWHYRPEALDAAMQHAHYPLQAILYTVALHRYLRWRLAGYDPEANLGGVIYLFLRGMTGPECPVIAGNPCGVFSWRPPVSLVVGLSDLFDLAPAGG